jgi:excinuclease ABC subunit A
MPVEKLNAFFRDMQLSGYENNIAGRILTEIQARLRYMNDTGLGYLTLNRLSSTPVGR